MNESLFHARRKLLRTTAIYGLNGVAALQACLPRPSSRANIVQEAPASPRHPDDFRPLEPACFQNPYPFYRMLRDDYPVYRLPNGVYCISRYDDIVTASRDIDTFSSAHQGIVANLPPGRDLLKEVKRFELLSSLGLIPADVLATSDPPAHTEERKIGHSCLNSHFVKTLESDVESLCSQMMDRFIDEGRVEFMQEFGWRLPMIFVIRLLGLPEQDYEQIKTWCVEILNSQNGTQSGAELMRSYASALAFLDYCWTEYLKAKQQPAENLMSVFARASANGDLGFDDRKAASAIFQLLIAGSDSSATTMGNALKMMIENPQLQNELREDPEKLNAFIEEVFRLESAFQGHFRWVKQDTEMHGIPLPRGSRIFLMWASGNRDERMFEHPDEIIPGRKNGKKHLTFGHGIHACIGRELARMEIRVVLKAFLDRTTHLRITSETPYVASMFARTLVKLPIAFERRA